MNISELLSFSVKHHASDLHLSAGLSPMMRVDGDLKKLNLPPLTKQILKTLLYDIMNDTQKAEYEKNWEIDFSFALENISRFRVNIFTQVHGPAAVFRVIPTQVATFSQLELPSILKTMLNKKNGLILVTGPTGSGKSTTLAALINEVNEMRTEHIITIEDPIEFVHQSKLSLINQRELNQHTHSFTQALRSALREDPDILLVGEMRDIETIRLALTAAETGHLVFATLHTSSAAKTINRIIDVFPAGEKEMVRAMLAESLQAVVSQVLIKRVGGGRVAACEIMLGTPAIRNLIRENKIAQMYSIIQTGQESGMQTLDFHLKQLLANGSIQKEEAILFAEDKKLF